MCCKCLHCHIDTFADGGRTLVCVCADSEYCADFVNGVTDCREYEPAERAEV